MSDARAGINPAVLLKALFGPSRKRSVPHESIKESVAENAIRYNRLEKIASHFVAEQQSGLA